MQKQNLQLYRGDSYLFEIELYDELDQPLALDGFEVDCLVSLGKVSFSPLIEKNGHVVKLTFLPEHTKDLKGVGTIRGEYDIQLKQQNVVITVVRGVVSITQDITP